ncbi:MAG: FkbM family methyltransferase [Halioglobus sp.]
MFRSFMYRAGRHLYARARRDLPNKPETNGEYWLLSQVMDHLEGNALFMDVGANRGDWTEQALRYTADKSRTLSVKAFEPSSYTRALLSQRFQANTAVTVYETALSSQAGTATFFIGRDGAGTNSLNSVSGNDTETVPVTTLDQFLLTESIGHVDFIKIDTEGFDALVIGGALASMAAGKIDLIQFEYNWRWLLNSQSLKNVFQLIDGLPYKLGKLAGEEILLFEEWHFEMDRFFENNYVLIRRGGPFDGLGVRAEYDASNVLCY